MTAGAAAGAAASAGASAAAAAAAAAADYINRGWTPQIIGTSPAVP